jgi:hypothetical protein
MHDGPVALQMHMDLEYFEDLPYLGGKRTINDERSIIINISFMA